MDDLTEDDTGIADVDDLLKVVDLTVRRGTDENQVYRLRGIVIQPIQPIGK